MLLTLERPALRYLAQNAPRNHNALQKFTDFVTKALYHDVPQTAPLPSSDLDTPVNIAACALAALRTCIKEITKNGPSSYSSQTIEFVVRTLPYIAAWIGYFVHHIIIPGCDHDFPFNFAKLSSGIVLQLLRCAKRFPLLHQELTSMKAAIRDDKDHAPAFFLSSVVSALLYSSSLPEDSSYEYKLFLSSQGPKYQWKVRCHCFHIISEIIPERPDTALRNLPHHALELSDIIYNEYSFFTDAFHSCVRFGLGVINASRKMGSKSFLDLVASMGPLYQAMLPLMETAEIANYMVDHGHLHRTCEMMRTIIHSNYLDVFLDPSKAIKGGSSILLKSVDVVVRGAFHIQKLVEIYGHRVAKQVFDDHAIFCLVRAYQLLSDNPTLVEDTYRAAYGNLMLHLIEGLAPYLTHYSVLASALRAQRKLQPFVCRDLMASEKWRAYETHLEDLREVKCQFDKAAGCICDSALCPNLHKHTTCRWRRCSGCAVFYYCSRDCQKQDWKARHRGQCASIRNDFNTNIRALSSQDRFFLEYDCRMVIQSYMQHNHALVRHIDYTTTPLTVNLRPLENYIGEDNYSHVAEVVRRKEGVAVVTVHSVGSMTTTTSIPRKSTLTCYEYSTLSKPLRYSREIRCL